MRKLLALMMVSTMFAIALTSDVEAQKGKGKKPDPKKTAATQQNLADAVKKILARQDESDALARKNHTEVMKQFGTVIGQGQALLKKADTIIGLNEQTLAISKKNGERLDTLTQEVQKWRTDEAARFQKFLEQNELLRKENEDLRTYNRRLEDRVSNLEGQVTVLRSRPPQTIREYRTFFRTQIVPTYIYYDNTWYGYGPAGNLYVWGYNPTYYVTYPTYYNYSYPYYYGYHYNYYRYGYWYRWRW